MSYTHKYRYGTSYPKFRVHPKRQPMAIKKRRAPAPQLIQLLRALLNTVSVS